MSILISVVIHSTPSDDCVLCQLLNTLVILSLAMALDLGAAFISHFRSSQAALTSLEWSYYAMSLYFMAAGVMLAVLVSAVLGIAFGVSRRRIRPMCWTQEQQEIA